MLGRQDNEVGKNTIFSSLVNKFSTLFGNRNNGNHDPAVIVKKNPLTFRERLAWIYFKEEEMDEEDAIEYSKLIDEHNHMEIMNYPVVLNGDARYTMDYEALQTFWHLNELMRGKHPVTNEPVTLIEFDTDFEQRIEAFVKKQEEKAIQREIERKERIRALEAELEALQKKLQSEIEKVKEEKQQLERAKNNYLTRLAQLDAEPKQASEDTSLLLDDAAPEQPAESSENRGFIPYSFVTSQIGNKRSLFYTLMLMPPIRLAPISPEATSSTFLRPSQGGES